MKSVKAVLVAALAIPLAGCLLSGKPKTAAPPSVPQPVAAQSPEPISIPQTNVDLPPAQTLDQAALKTAVPVEAAIPPADTKPDAPPPKNPHPATAPPPVTKPAEQPQAATELARPPIQETLPADEQKRLRASAQDNQTKARALLDPVEKRHLTAKESRTVVDIKQFLQQSKEAENNGDLRLAEQLAERAYTLAKGLQGGK